MDAYRAAPDSVALLDTIAGAVPRTRGSIEAERELNGAALPHLEMAHVARWFVDDLRRSGGRPGPEASRLLQLLAAEFQGGNGEVDDVIALSFLGTLEKERDRLAIRAALPLELATYQARWYDFDDEGLYRRMVRLTSRILTALGAVWSAGALVLAISGSSAFVAVAFAGLLFVCAAILTSRTGFGVGPRSMRRTR